MRLEINYLTMSKAILGKGWLRTCLLLAERVYPTFYQHFIKERENVLLFFQKSIVVSKAGFMHQSFVTSPHTQTHARTHTHKHTHLRSRVEESRAKVQGNYFSIVPTVLGNIMLTYPCNVHPLTPHFYIVKMGFTWGIHYFLIFALKHRLWVLVRTASVRRF